MKRIFPEYNGPERWELTEHGKIKWWVEIRPIDGEYLVENDQGRSWREDWDSIERRRSMLWDARANRKALVLPNQRRNEEWVLSQLWKMVGRRTNVAVPLKRAALRAKHGKLRFDDRVVDEILSALISAGKISLLDGKRILVRPGFEKPRK